MSQRISLKSERPLDNANFARDFSHLCGVDPLDSPLDLAALVRRIRRDTPSADTLDLSIDPERDITLNVSLTLAQATLQTVLQTPYSPQKAVELERAFTRCYGCDTKAIAHAQRAEYLGLNIFVDSEPTNPRVVLRTGVEIDVSIVLDLVTRYYSERLDLSCTVRRFSTEHFEQPRNAYIRISHDRELLSMVEEINRILIAAYTRENQTSSKGPYNEVVLFIPTSPLLHTTPHLIEYLTEFSSQIRRLKAILRE